MPFGLEDQGRLLRAARVVLVRNGWQGVKVRSVAREADVSIRTFYRHFGSKNELLVAVLRHNMERLADQLWTDARGDRPALERVEAWIDRLLDIPSNAAEISGMFSRSVHQLRSEFPEQFREIEALVTDPLVSVLQGLRAEANFAHVRPELDAKAIVRIVVSFNEAILNDVGGLRPEKAREIVVPFVLRALLCASTARH